MESLSQQFLIRKSSINLQFHENETLKVKSYGWGIIAIYSRSCKWCSAYIQCSVSFKNAVFSTKIPTSYQSQESISRRKNLIEPQFGKGLFFCYFLLFLKSVCVPVFWLVVSKIIYVFTFLYILFKNFVYFMSTRSVLEVLKMNWQAF